MSAHPRRGRRRHRRRRHDDARAAARARVPGLGDRAVRVRALGRPGARRRSDGPGADRRRRHRAASTSRCSPPARRARASGRRGSSSTGATVIDNSSCFRRDPEVPLVVSEVNPHALERPPRPDRQPELHDDADARGARADPPRGRDRAAGGLHLPVGLGHRARRRSRSSRPGARVAARDRDRRRRRSIPQPIAFNVIGAVEIVRRRRRPHRRGAQDDVRDAQDPRGRVDRRWPSRASGCPVRICHSEAVNVQTREPTLGPRSAARCSPRRPGVVVEDVPHAAPLARGRPRRGVRRPDPPRRVPPARAQHVDRRRQPPQGRRHERGPDRRAAGRARTLASAVAAQPAARAAS